MPFSWSRPPRGRTSRTTGATGSSRRQWSGTWRLLARRSVASPGMTPKQPPARSEHRRIIAFRNRLIHGYDLLDDSLVWETVKTEVPVLLSEVEALRTNSKNQIPQKEKQATRAACKGIEPFCKRSAVSHQRSALCSWLIAES